MFVVCARLKFVRTSVVMMMHMTCEFVVLNKLIPTEESLKHLLDFNCLLNIS
jgi:hypothetical protein